MGWRNVLSIQLLLMYILFAFCEDTVEVKTYPSKHSVDGQVPFTIMDAAINQALQDYEETLRYRITQNKRGYSKNDK